MIRLNFRRFFSGPHLSSFSPWSLDIFSLLYHHLFFLCFVLVSVFCYCHLSVMWRSLVLIFCLVVCAASCLHMALWSSFICTKPGAISPHSGAYWRKKSTTLVLKLGPVSSNKLFQIPFVLWLGMSTWSINKRISTVQIFNLPFFMVEFYRFSNDCVFASQK